MGEAKIKTIKVCLTNRGADQETPWAHDLGPAPGPSGSRHVRLANIPFLHAKPTWGDVIVVSPSKAGVLTWDRNGVSWAKLASRIASDGGRWTMIVDYAPRPRQTSAAKVVHAIAEACAELDVVTEGERGPRGGERGRVYLAVNYEDYAASVMRGLRAAALPCDLVQIHPSPPKAGKKQAGAKARAKRPAATAKRR